MTSSFDELWGWVRDQVMEGLHSDLSAFQSPDGDQDETALVTRYVQEQYRVEESIRGIHVLEHERHILAAMVLKVLAGLDEDLDRDPTLRITSEHRRWMMEHGLSEYGVRTTGFLNPRDLRVGDRVEYTGPDDYGPNSGSPRPGERGTIIHLSPYDDVVAWDEAGSVSGSLVPHLKRIEGSDPTG